MNVPAIQDSRTVPSAFKPIGEIKETTPSGRTDYRRFYAYGPILVVIQEYTSNANKDPATGKPKLLFSQLEFPMDTANWIVRQLEPFARDGVMPGTVTKLDAEIDGEKVSLNRGPAIAGPKQPGWALTNLSRRYRDDDIERFQKFPMSDAFLWKQGMFNLWKNIAQRHEQGEF